MALIATTGSCGADDGCCTIAKMLINGSRHQKMVIKLATAILYSSD